MSQIYKESRTHRESTFVTVAQSYVLVGRSTNLLDKLQNLGHPSELWFAAGKYTKCARLKLSLRRTLLYACGTLVVS